MSEQCSHGILFTEPCEQCDRIWETKVTDKLFLELSQFSKAKTRRELRLESINEALRSQVAELQRYSEMWKQEVVVVKRQLSAEQEAHAATIQREAKLTTQLDEAAKQEPRAWWDSDEYGALIFAESVLHKERLEKDGWAMRPLYDRPINLPDLIEQAKAEEREACAIVCEGRMPVNTVSQVGYRYMTAEECAAAIRARKP